MMRIQGRRPGFHFDGSVPWGINFENFTPKHPFRNGLLCNWMKSAAVPERLEAYSCRVDWYAVFRFRGLPSQVAALMQHIFWNGCPHQSMIQTTANTWPSCPKIIVPTIRMRKKNFYPVPKTVGSLFTLLFYFFCSDHIRSRTKSDLCLPGRGADSEAV